MIVKFNDLEPIHSSIKTDINEALQLIIDRNEFIDGSFTEQFELNFAKYLSVKNCISCGNGTDALEIAIWALGITSGDEVLVPAHSWISTASCVIALGAKPVFVPCNTDDYTMNTNEIESKITCKTKAIIAVHLFGHSADMNAICSIANSYGLKVIEDAAQAHGALYNGKKCGSIGDIGCFSFYPSKNLGCIGDGGCVVTNNDEIALQIRSYKNCGQSSKNSHRYWGRNSRMDNFQAAVLNIKLPQLDYWNNQRRMLANYYNKNINPKKYVLPIEKNYAYHVYHIYCIQTQKRDSLIKIFSEANIEYGIHYPKLLPHLFPSADLFYKNDYCSDIISLPFYIGMSTEKANRVIEVLNSA